MSSSKRGFVMADVLTAMVIIGVLMLVLIAAYTNFREGAFDRMAKADLRKLQAAQQAHRIDMREFYPLEVPAGVLTSQADILAINANLRVALNANPGRPWNYTVFSSGCVQATRNSANARGWYLPIGDITAEPQAVGAHSCTNP